jgi:hypothetical protein
LQGSIFIPNRDLFVASTNALLPGGKRADEFVDLFAYDIKLQKPIAALRGHKKALPQFAVAENGRTMASGDSQGNVFIWDMEQVKAR